MAPELVYVDGSFGLTLLSCQERTIVAGARWELSDKLKLSTMVSLKNKALLPGLVNAHSHAFQRHIGRTVSIAKFN
jgi:cytosine/adenosine deaminase-related metal-dependent hydrolase